MSRASRPRGLALGKLCAVEIDTELDATIGGARQRLHDWPVRQDIGRDLNGLHDQIPITAADVNSVTFQGRKKEAIEKSISGSVDRITGKIDADETWLWQTGSLTLMSWDLHCKPTKRLF